MKYLLRLGNSMFGILAILWTYFSVYFLFQYLNIDYTNLSRTLASILLILVVLIFLSIHFKIYTKRLVSLIYRFLSSHKWLLLIAVICFQLIVTVTSLRLAKADTTVVYNLATDIKFASESDYIAVNPNNFLLLVWYRFNAFIFGENLLFALAIWNLIFIDLAIIITYKLTKLLGNQTWADLQFIMMSIIIGLSPQHIYTYSDPLALFLVSLFIYVTMISLQKNHFVLSVINGVLIALAYGVRPPVLIFVIAGVIVSAYQVLNSKIAIRQIIKSLLVMSSVFLMISLANKDILKNQAFVRYEENYSRTLLYYIDLGLTYSGNIHAEISPEVYQARGEDRNPTALKEIKSRLSDYNFESFTGHLFYKYYWVTNEGMFGWMQESVLNEDSPQTVPWLKELQNTKFASWVRTYIYTSGENYLLYGGAMQIIWIGISLGLLIYSMNYFTLDNTYLLWMQITIFGFLLFLMIFEAGRTRYLIQFLPAITTVSSYGLSKFLYENRK